LQAAQAVHAAFSFAHRYPADTAYWMASSNFLVIVAVGDEDSLIALSGEAIRRGITTVVIREPDCNDEVTAVALTPGKMAQKLCANLPLALRRPAMT